MAKSQRKNIIWILTDQQRYDSLGHVGRSICKTPNIDRLAAEGVRFTNAYSVCSLCSPARVSMLTGQYPHTHNVRTNTGNANLWPIREMADEAPLISRMLGDAGYRCGYSGKWHCGEERVPTTCGFEGMDAPGYGNPYKNTYYETYLQEHGMEVPAPFLQLKPLRPDNVPPEYLAVPTAHWSGGTLPGPAAACEPAFVAQYGIDLLEKFADEDAGPFFLVVSFWGPHHPCYLPEPYASLYDPQNVELWPNFLDELKNKPDVHDRYRRTFYHEHREFSDDDWRKVIAKYWGYCTFIDHQVGRLLQALDSLGIADDTAVMYTTDHGDMLGSHGGMFDKGENMYEETYHIPLIARVPGLTPPGQKRRQPVSNLDMYATALKLAGVAPRQPCHSRSLVPLMNDDTAPWPDDVVAEFHGLRIGYNQRMVRWADYKYVFNSPDTDELYDLGSDPHELTNLINDPAYAAIADEGRERLIKWMRETNDPIIASSIQQLTYGK